jgi:hypothetical protein
MEDTEWHCGCGCDPWPSDPFCGEDPPAYAAEENARIRKVLPKKYPKRCNAKSKARVRHSPAKLNLESLVRDMKYELATTKYPQYEA